MSPLPNATLGSLLRNRRVEIDHPVGVGTAGWLQEIFELNLSLDEVAELVALECQALVRLAASHDAFDWSAMFDFSLDAQVTGGLELYDSTLIHKELTLHWHGLVGAQETGQYQNWHEMIHFPPGIYVSENPALNFYKDQDDLMAEANANLFYRVVKPTVTELAAIVARSR